MKTLEIDFTNASQQTRERAKEKGLIEKLDQTYASISKIDGEPVMLKVVKFYGSHVGDGTLAEQIASLTAMVDRYEFVGGPENVSVVSDTEYEWGETQNYQIMSGWVKITPAVESAFKAYRKIVLDEDRKVKQAKVEELRARAARLAAEADALAAQN